MMAFAHELSVFTRMSNTCIEFRGDCGTQKNKLKVLFLQILA